LRPSTALAAVTSPVPRDVWGTLLKSDSNAVVSQSLPWRDAVLASGRYQDVSRLYEFPSGRQVVLPLARHRWLPERGAVAMSWPRGWAVGGPISQEGRISQTEAAAVLADVAGRKMLAAEIHLRHDADRAWLDGAGQFRVEALPYWNLDLAGGFGQVWSHKFRGSARTAIRKAQRSGLDVEVDVSGRLLGEFFELYQKSIVRWAAMQHAPVWLTRRRLAGTNPKKLALIAGQFGHDCATWVARSEGKPVAAIIILRSGSYASYYRGAMDKEGATSVRANEFLHSLAIEEACRDGYRYYEMGRGGPGSSLAAFKAKFGADLVFNHALRAERVPIHAAERLPKELVKKVIGFRQNT
jgi:hypothetical protein